MVNKIRWILYLSNIFSYKIFRFKKKSYEIFYRNAVLKDERYISFDEFFVVIFMRKGKSILSGEFNVSNGDTVLEIIRKIKLAKKIILSKQIKFFACKQLNNSKNNHSFVEIRNNAKKFIEENGNIIKNYIIFELRVCTNEYYKLVDKGINITYFVPDKYWISIDMINKANNYLELASEYKTDCWQEAEDFLQKNTKNINLLEVVETCRLHGLFNVIFYDQDIVEIIKYFVNYPEVFDLEGNNYIQRNNLEANTLSIDIIKDQSFYPIYKNGLLVKRLNEYQELEILEGEDKYKYYVKCDTIHSTKGDCNRHRIHILNCKGLRIEKTGFFSAVIVLASYKVNGKILYFTNGLLKGSLKNIKHRNIFFLEDKYKCYNYEGPKGISIDNVNLSTLEATEENEK